MVGLVLAAGLTMELVVSIDDGNARLLDAQANQVSTAFAATVPPLQDPLVAADGIASSVGIKAFRPFVRSVVGRNAPFRSVSLWQTARGTIHLLAGVGAPAELPRDPVAFASFLRQVHPDSKMNVTSIRNGPAGELGFAEREGGQGEGLVVYAEGRLPKPPRPGHASSSPFAGLSFAIFLGRTTAPSDLIDASIPVPVQGRSRSEVVAFGTTEVTIIATLAGRSATLPPQLPWLVGTAGVALSIALAAATERLARRRRLAELVAIERGQSYDLQRDIADTLQHAILPDTPESHPGVEIATKYVAGDSHVDVGGDWYDIVAIDEDHLFVTVGDVSGRGLRAARLMATMRPAIRAYAVQGDDPAIVLSKLDDLVSVVRDGCFATVLCAVLDVPHRKVTLSSAGHPPPLLISPSGAYFIATPPSTPVGVSSPLAPVSSTTFVPAGSTLLLYTDGLIERRDRPLSYGFEKLRTSADGLKGSPEDTIDALLVATTPQGTEDDLAVLALRWESTVDITSLEEGPAPTASFACLSGVTSERRFSGEPASIRAARDFVAAALPELSRDDLDVVVLLVSELAANAVVHARSVFEVAVSVDMSQGHVRVGVTDEGGGAPVQLGLKPGATRGRGLQLVDGLSDDWGVEWVASPASKRVWFEFALPRQRAIRTADLPMLSTIQ
jgi:serine phosphatase RsbU (regulator of sigma subunit)/anti-sigma regulatory factor (Ser/Thr protein kinase)